jgi:hypothetical protein
LNAALSQQLESMSKELESKMSGMYKVRAWPGMRRISP